MLDDFIMNFSWEELELEDGVEATKSYIVELADKRMYAQKETKPNREGRVVANITAFTL